MKFNRSTYFSIFFLLCFIASFGAKTVQNLSTNYSLCKFNHKKLALVSHKYDNGSSSSDSILEESENETEDVFFNQVCTLPYFISYFKYDILKILPVAVNPLTEKTKNPIYVSVCNFRI